MERRWCAINERQTKIIKELTDKAIELMADWSASRNRQKAFILNYLENGFQNATQAAKEAGFSSKTARTSASNMLTGMNNYEHIPPVVEALQTAFDERRTELSLLNSVDIQQFWARVIRGEEKDIKLVGTGEGVQEVMEVPVDLSVRLSASDKYAKALGMYQNNVNATITGDITFEIGAWDDDS